jgi:hypothetical protein
MVLYERFQRGLAPPSVWRVAANQFQVIWEFFSFPSDSPNIFLRLNCTDKATGLASAVEFKLPGARHLRLRKMGS